MICKNCKEAGKLAQEHPDTKESKLIKMHNRCPGGTWCDCLHRVGPKRKETPA